ncbi:SDR family oxidoreductase [Halopseudomonas yangmingensis]|uniref:3-oxoacyl-[acyl-carrier protein] reductase n=1 Tax=Halopseudomonas yangmingensis TaxID=1720063 RepID=A0A1I4RKU4_9GAMM|nr:SDR family oxidoreductase [Halopseudomonas yangmingensis]SFM52849.1 3-oxoacyl-[acyl-carrier protein] reductase [Halopseudomonas yangmingensis]
MNLDLTGKRALVCGASQGIGEACARQLAEQGAEVLLLARSAERLQAIVDSLPNSGGRRHALLALDANDREALLAGVGAELAHGDLHIWINNTGGPAPGPANTAAPEAFAAAFTQHLVNAQALLQLLLPGMRRAGYGRILNVLSTSVKQPIANLGVSNTIRAAVANWAKTLASELGPDGITVNNILPGLTRTPRLDSLVAHMASQNGRTVEQVEAAMQAQIPLRRFADPAEFANVAGFLASPAAAYVTGINVPVDGGNTGSL